jgi:hypothetical protein
MAMLNVMAGGSDEDVYFNRKPGLENSTSARNTDLSRCPPAYPVHSLKIRTLEA